MEGNTLLPHPVLYTHVAQNTHCHHPAPTSVSSRHRCGAIMFNFISDKPVISLALGLGIDQEKITGNISSWLSFFTSPGLTAYFCCISEQRNPGRYKRHKNCQDLKLKINVGSQLENIFLRGIWCVSGMQGSQSTCVLRCLLDEGRKYAVCLKTVDIRTIFESKAD